MIDSTVDLPQPECPRMQTNSPGSTCALTSLTATNGPRRRVEDLRQTGQLERRGSWFASALRARARSCGCSAIGAVAAAPGVHGPGVP